jgi:predicted nucleotidyltransferase
MDPNVKQRLQAAMPQLRCEYHIAELFVFGSYARGQESSTSDVDIAVQLSQPATLRSFMALQFFLEELLGKPVDLVEISQIRQELFGSIQRDFVNVA